ncbi:MAG: hypothetical protein HDS67_02365 [Bacteroidales bacterium]|nr:hypothetical protein [Bacteroidales bacterium]
MKKKVENEANIKYENDNVSIEMDILKNKKIVRAPQPGQKHSVAAIPSFLISREAVIDEPEIESWNVIEAAIEAASETTIENLIDDVTRTIEKFTGDVCHLNIRAELTNGAIDTVTFSFPDGTLNMGVVRKVEFDKTELMTIADTQKRKSNIHGMTATFKTAARKIHKEARCHPELFTAEKLTLKLVLAVCDGPSEENESEVANPASK